jgi:hypothetical protein
MNISIQIIHKLRHWLKNSQYIYCIYSIIILIYIFLKSRRPFALSSVERVSITSTELETTLCSLRFDDARTFLALVTGLIASSAVGRDAIVDVEITVHEVLNLLAILLLSLHCSLSQPKGGYCWARSVSE